MNVYTYIINVQAIHGFLIRSSLFLLKILSGLYTVTLSTESLAFATSEHLLALRFQGTSQVDLNQHMSLNLQILDKPLSISNVGGL